MTQSIFLQQLPLTDTIEENDLLYVVKPNGQTYVAHAVKGIKGNVTGDLTGNVTGDLTGNVTGTASGNTTISPIDHGIVLSGEDNVLHTLAPVAETTKAIFSTGLTSDPIYRDLTNTDLPDFLQNGTGAVARTYLSKNQDIVSVEDFIPIDTDITTADCSPYIQAALNASVGLSLYFPRLYHIAATINLISNVSLFGNGRGGLTFADAANISALTGGTISDVSIIGLRFIDVGYTQSTGTSGPSGTYTGISNTNFGININGAIVNDIEISNCYFNGVDRPIFLYADQGSLATITNNIIDICGQAGIAVSSNIYSFNQVVIANNQISQVWGQHGVGAKFSDGIYLQAVQQGSVTGNVIYDYRRIGIVVEGNPNPSGGVCANIAITGNTITYGHDWLGTEDNAGVWTEPTKLNDGCTIAGNTIDNRQNAAAIADARNFGVYTFDGAIVSANTILGCGVGIRSMDALITANRILGVGTGIQFHGELLFADLLDTHIFNICDNIITQIAVAGIIQLDPVTTVPCDYKINNNKLLNFTGLGGFGIKIQPSGFGNGTIDVSGNDVTGLTNQSGISVTQQNDPGASVTQFFKIDSNTVSYSAIPSSNYIGIQAYSIGNTIASVSDNEVNICPVVLSFGTPTRKSTLKVNGNIVSSVSDKSPFSALHITSAVDGGYLTCQVKDNHLYNSDRNGLRINVSGVTINGVADIRNNIFENNGQSALADLAIGVSMRAAIYIYESTPPIVFTPIVRGNTFVSNSTLTTLSVPSTTASLGAGQWFSMYFIYGGTHNINLFNVQDNTFIFTNATVNGVYPGSLNQLPCAVGSGNGANQSVLSLGDYVSVYNNISSKALNQTGGTDNIYDLYNDGAAQSFLGFASTTPTVGSYKIGDYFKAIAPASGGYIGWICTTAGTPGTWKTFGLIS